MRRTVSSRCTTEDVDRLVESCESRIVRAGTIADALIDIGRLIRTTAGWDYAESFLVNGGRSEVQTLAADHDGRPEDLAFEATGREALAEHMDDDVMRSLRSGDFLRYDDLTGSPPGTRSARAVEAGLLSVLGIPIRGLHGPLGMLIFGSRRSFVGDPWVEAVTRMQERLTFAFQRRANQIEYGQLWKLSPDLMAIFDRRGLLLDANPAAIQALGWSLEELFSIGIGGIVHPDDRPLAAATMEQLIDGGAVNLLLRVRRSDNAYRTVSIRGVAMTAEATIILVARDVTDEKLLQREHSRLFRAYDMLRRSAEVARSAEDPHALFLAVLRVAVEVGGYRMAWIGTLDPETRIIRPVAQVGDTTGYLEGIAVPIDDMNLGSGPVGRAVHTRRPAISRNIHVDTGMAPWRARAIAAGFCSVAAFPIVVDDVVVGNISFFSSEFEWFGEDEELVLGDFVRDLEISLELFKREEERTRAEAAVREMESRRLRAQRLESIGTLAGGIAHDLNNTLAPIMLAAEMIRAHPASGAFAEYLHAIEVSAERGSALVKQVLGFARGIEGEHVRIAPGRVVRDVEALLVGATLKDVRIDVSLAADLPTIVAEPTQLLQVLLNLCVNGAQAMSGRGRLTLRAEVVHVDSQRARGIVGGYPGAFVCFAVSDTGSGIAPEHLDRIFEPFFTTKPQGEGTGLGLSTSLGIVQQHKGFITVQSTVGVGSTFRVFLPLEGREGEPQEAHRPVAAVHKGGGARILVVDDEPLIRELIQESLERQGYRVESAENGAAGIVAFTRLQDEIDLVITDVKMPVMGGLEMLAAVQRMRPEVRAIAITGYGESLGDEAELRPLGIRERLHKPFDSAVLFRVVREALDAP